MLALLLAAGYLAGSIPTGLLLARRLGIDLRRAGSGNIGATNVLRTAGVRLGLLTLAGDALKGAGPTLLALQVLPDRAGVVGLAAFLGHLFPPWLGFQGGKGVATALGVLLVLEPWAAGLGVSAFASVVLATGFVSVASLAGCSLAAGAIWLTGSQAWPAVAAMVVLVWLRHAGNLRRLIAGTEPRLGRSRRGE